MDKKLWYKHTMEYYSPIKRNILELVLMRWMNLEPITQSEIRQKKKNKYINVCVCVCVYIYIYLKSRKTVPVVHS